MKSFPTCIILIFILLYSGCDHSGTGTGQDNPREIILAEDIDQTNFPIDPATIFEVDIDGDLLTLGIRYGGGCKFHEFELYGSMEFMPWYPVESGIFLSHNANGDACEALMGEELRFDLTPLKEAYMEIYPDYGALGLRIYEPGAESPLDSLILYLF